MATSAWTPKRVLASVNGQEVWPAPVGVFENRIYPKRRHSLCKTKR